MPFIDLAIVFPLPCINLLLPFHTAFRYLEGTVGVTISDCNITRVDGNGLIVSGFNRNATIANNSLSWIGDNAIVVWCVSNGGCQV